MRTNRVLLGAYSAILIAGGFAAGQLSARDAVLNAQVANRVFEIRTYTAPEGKLETLHTRFRDHTLRMFQKHGMTNVVYLKPLDPPRSQNTIVYLLAHASRDAAKRSWAAFAADPEWKKISAESQVDGRIVEKVDSVFAEPADYSPMK